MFIFEDGGFDSTFDGGGANSPPECLMTKPMLILNVLTVAFKTGIYCFFSAPQNLLRTIS